MSEAASQDVRQLDHAAAPGVLPEAAGDTVAWLKSVGALRSQCSSQLACAAHDCPVPCEACSAEGEVEVVCTACRHVFPAVPVSVQDRACASEAEFIRTRHIAFFSEARALIAKEGAKSGEPRVADPKAPQGDHSAEAVRNFAKVLGRALTRVGLRIRSKEMADRRRREERRVAARKRAEERKRLEGERRRAEAAAAARAAAKYRQYQTVGTLVIIAACLVGAGYWISSRSSEHRSDPLPAEAMVAVPSEVQEELQEEVPAEVPVEVPAEEQSEVETAPAPVDPASVDGRNAAEEPAPTSDDPWDHGGEELQRADPAPPASADAETIEPVPLISPDGAIAHTEGSADGGVRPGRVPVLREASAWLGVALSNLDDATAQSRGLPGAMGALVDDIVSGGPAEAAGLRRGDVLLVINGEMIDSVPDVLRELRQLQPGVTIEFRLMRDRKDMRTSVTLGRRPAL